MRLEFDAWVHIETHAWPKLWCLVVKRREFLEWRLLPEQIWPVIRQGLKLTLFQPQITDLWNSALILLQLPLLNFLYRVNEIALLPAEPVAGPFLLRVLNSLSLIHTKTFEQIKTICYLVWILTLNFTT